MPATRSAVDIIARRFNEAFTYRWERVIDFLKLHYVLSRRDDSDYWRDNRDAASMPPRLAELLELWRHRAPSRSPRGQPGPEGPRGVRGRDQLLTGVRHPTSGPSTATPDS